MGRRLLSFIIIASLLFQLTSCVFVEDALYDMGIKIDLNDYSDSFDNVIDEISHFFSGISEDLSNEFQDMVMNLKNLFTSEDFSENTVELNSKYVLQWPLEKIVLPSSQKNIYLLPLHGYAAVNAINRETGEVVSLSDAGFVMKSKFLNTSEKFTIDNYTICGKTSGLGYIDMQYYENGVLLESIDNVAVFVAECNFEETNNYYTFPDAEKAYITAALDVFYSINSPKFITVNVPDQITYLDNLLINVTNLSELLKSTLKIGESYEENRVKAIFGDFFTDYVEKHLDEQNNATNDGEIMSDRDLLKLSIDIALYVHNNFLNDNTISKKYKDALVGLHNLYTTIGDGIYAVTNYKTYKNLGDLLDIIYSNLELFNGYRETDEGMAALSGMIRDYEDLHRVIIKFKLKFEDTDFVNFFVKTFGDSSGNMNVPGVVTTVIGEVAKAGFNLFDFITYICYDYDNNVSYLLFLRDALVEYKSTLAEEDTTVDLNIMYLNELIEDYTTKYTTAVYDLICKGRAQIVEFLAGLNPVYSVASFVLSIAAFANNSAQKEKAFVLNYYLVAIYQTLDPVDDLFIYGKMTIDYDDLRYRISLFLNLHLEIDNTLLKYTSGEEKNKLKKTIKYIETTLSPYLSPT